MKKSVPRLSRAAKTVLNFALIPVILFVLWALLDFPAFSPALAHRRLERQNLCGPSELLCVYPLSEHGNGYYSAAGVRDGELYISLCYGGRTRFLLTPVELLRYPLSGTEEIVLPTQYGFDSYTLFAACPDAARAELSVSLLIDGTYDPDGSGLRDCRLELFYTSTEAERCGGFFRFRVPKRYTIFNAFDDDYSDVDANLESRAWSGGLTPARFEATVRGFDGTGALLYTFSQTLSAD
ncbi:MAG: hypothetical protein ACI4QB_02220 [Eubacteriales bacterium]